MAGSEVPDSGVCHPEAAGGIAFNGDVGLGVARRVLAIIAAQPGVRTICDLALALLRPGGTMVIGTPYHGYLKNVAISVLGGRVPGFWKNMIAVTTNPQPAAQ